MHTFLLCNLCNEWTFDPAVIFDSTRLGDSTVVKKPLQDVWARRGGGRLFDMVGWMVTMVLPSGYQYTSACVDRSRHNRIKEAMTKCVHLGLISVHI